VVVTGLESGPGRQALEPLGIREMLCDITDRSRVAELYSRVRAELGPVGILVNSAGTNVGNRMMANIDATDFDRVLAVNTTGVFNCIREALVDMRARRSGLILNIISLAGLEGIAIGETLADPASPAALPTIKVEEPTVRMTFGVNTSPFAGREGRWGTSRNLRERLFEELRTNVALRVEETGSAENFLVSGRGELHLGILIETMRREGYEFQVSRPEVIFHKADDGALLEPYEEVHIETSNETVGAVVEMLGARRGQMMDMQDAGQGMTRMVYIAPTRGLLGFRYQFLTSTRGAGVMHTVFHGYDEMAGPMSTRTTGSLVAWEAGETTAYALKSAEERGTLFYGPGVPVYEGMVIGENTRAGDIAVNVAKKKHLTNVRASRGDMEIRLTPPRQMSLDEAIEYLADDELLEVTPESYRIRKRILDTEERGKQTKKIREQLEEA
jgi:GTP-binding protein